MMAGAMPRKPRTSAEMAPEQQAALSAAKAAQRRFERAEQAAAEASDERAVAFRAALATKITHQEMANALGWTNRSHVDTAARGRGRPH